MLLTREKTEQKKSKIKSDEEFLEHKKNGVTKENKNNMEESIGAFVMS